jgi:hypothetical protein
MRDHHRFGFGVARRKRTSLWFESIVATASRNN